MKEDLVPRNTSAPCGEDIAFIPRERPELEEAKEDRPAELSMKPLPPDRSPVPRPYASEE